MTPGPAPASSQGAGSTRLAFALAMAMFVLVVNTSLMNVSISAVVGDLDTTVSGVQSAIALEALANQQQQIADKLDEDAEVTSNAKLEHLLAEEPKAVQDEVLSINADATNRSLQVALLVPVIAGLIGLFNAFRIPRCIIWVDVRSQLLPIWRSSFGALPVLVWTKCH